MTDRRTGHSILDLAHELRTPLHTILTAADLVLSGDAGRISAQAASLIGEIARAARRLEELSERLLSADPAAPDPVPVLGRSQQG